MVTIGVQWDIVENIETRMRWTMPKSKSNAVVKEIFFWLAGHVSVTQKTFFKKDT